MDDSAIRNYCTWARRELRDEVMRRCAIYGISEEPEAPAGADSVSGRVLTDEEKRQRRELLEEVGRDGLDRTVERAAYTWFNRIAAIRFMEVNDRLPSRTRLLSANDGSFRPQALQEPLSVDIEGLDRAEVARLVQEGDDEATFRCLLLAQCHELSACMPGVFERVGAAMELLLPDGLLREGGVVERMVDGIPEPDWTEGVEIVGWMYQYYNQERKDEYFASKRKATADDIAPATQLFTPEWIVRYLVDNSLGRLWMLNFPESRLKGSMDYYIDPGDEHEEDFLRIGSPEDITFCDPCCGSGHILVYAFDLLARMYEERGYSRREIPRLVLEKNLTGIEIDRRAGQLASFALAMKACEYDRRFLSRGVQPNVTVLEPVRFGEGELAGTDLLAEGHDLLDAFDHLDEIGSLYVPGDVDLALVEKAIDAKRDPNNMFAAHTVSELERMMSELELLSREFSVTGTNPPYMGSNNTSSWLSRMLKKNYEDEKSDLCTCFIPRCLAFTHHRGSVAIITSDTCMYLKSFENMRKTLINEKTILSFIDTRGTNAHPDVFDANAGWVILNASSENFYGSYIKLDQGVGEKGGYLRTAAADASCDWLYKSNSRIFNSLPGNQIAYWISEAMLNVFKHSVPLESVATVKQGLATADNERFLRLWWEPSQEECFFGCKTHEQSKLSNQKWYPCDKGGLFRRWSGNTEYLINWQNDGTELYCFERAVIRNPDYYFKPYIAWSDVSSGAIAFRYRGYGFIFEHCANALFSDDDTLFRLSGLLNSSTASFILKLLAPTLHFGIGHLASFPVYRMHDWPDAIATLARECTQLSLDEYNSFETSWSFKRHPLVAQSSIAEASQSWEAKCDERYFSIKNNEETLNKIFAESYGLTGEVPVTVPDDKVSVRRYNRERDVKSLVSYAVGCMMGRYSLDVDGLVLADQGASLQDYLEKVPNPTFMPDEDGIIPLTDVEYFHDDATGLFVDFLKAAYGEETLEENLAFVAESLGGEGTSREVIRDYFRNQFFADHCKTYSVTGSGKRPIYWLFDSGKKGGFRALFYMHRYTPDLLARLRTDYVHPQQERYRNQIEHIDEVLPTADRSEAARLKKERKKLSDQLAETNAYEERVHHLADQMIRIDLDDGVKHNYALFQDVLAKIK